MRKVYEPPEAMVSIISKENIMELSFNGIAAISDELLDYMKIWGGEA